MPEMQGGEVLNHLIDIERKASELERDAEAEAESRLIEARRKAEEGAQAMVEAKKGELEAAYAAASEALTARHRAAVEEYRLKLGQAESRPAALAAYLDGVLAARQGGAAAE